MIINKYRELLNWPLWRNYILFLVLKLTLKGLVWLCQGETSTFDEVKRDLDEQARVNRDEFANMDDHIRVQYEGFR